jgi:hypothetical protein
MSYQGETSMFKRVLLALMVVGLAVGVVPISKTYAHHNDTPPAVTTTCEALSVDLSNYPATMPANPGQPYIAPTFHIVTIPAVGQVTHDEYKYKATKQYGGGSPTIYATTNGTSSSSNQADWLLSAPSKVSNYSNWSQIDHRVVVDLAGTPEQQIPVMDDPGQPFIPATPEKTNTIVVDIDSSNVENTTFSTSYSNTFNYGNNFVAHTYHVVVDAWDGTSKDLNVEGTSVPCDNLDHKIDICHANNGIKEYVEQNVDFDSIFKNNGHAEHQDGRDIIPPFDYVKNGIPGHFDGQNWDNEGQTIYNNHCVVVPEKPADIVDVKTETSVDCETQIVTIVTTTTTTGTELVNNEWVATEPVVTTETTTREATEQEITDCIPDKPADIVEVVTTEDPIDCDTNTVTITTTTTTTTNILVGNEWVPAEPVVTIETSTRPATEAEIATCKDDDGDVLGESTDKGVKSLPNTSGDSTAASSMFVAPVVTLLTLIGIIARSVIVRRA